jgi:serine/threonine protein kinase
VRKDLVENVVAALRGERGAPFRRSRHATTWKVQVAGLSGESTIIFVKQLDAARGLIAWAKTKTRPQRSVHVLRISDCLLRDNLGVPRVLLIGENRDTGNEAIVTSEAPGLMLTRWMNPSHRTDRLLRRGILHQLGSEIARLHLSGYVHGDLTPFNIFATGDQPIAISFIDHEGTERTSRLTFNVVRNRMRNLVQLGHFDIPGVSLTDKLRVFASYAAAIGLSGRGRSQALIRLTKMIERRRQRDRANKRGATQPAIIAQKGTVRS